MRRAEVILDPAVLEADLGGGDAQGGRDSLGPVPRHRTVPTGVLAHQAWSHVERIGQLRLGGARFRDGDREAESFLGLGVGWPRHVATLSQRHPSGDQQSYLQE